MLYKGSISPGKIDEQINYKHIDRKLIIPKLPEWKSPADGANGDADGEGGGGRGKPQKK